MFSVTNTIQLQLSDGVSTRDSNTTNGVATFTPGTASVFEIYFNGTNNFGIVIDAVEATEAAALGGRTGPDTLNRMALNAFTALTNGAVAVTLAYNTPVTGANLTALRAYLNAIRDDINAETS